MTIDFSKDVEHVAKLARLELTNEEKEKMAGQLSDILDTARRIQELNTDAVEPTSHVIEFPATMRDDLVGESLTLNRVLQNAPMREKDFFRVPGIAKNGNDDQ